MAKSTILCRQTLIHHSSRNLTITSSPRRASTSPQRKGVAAPAVATSLKQFNDIPGPMALPMLRYSAHVLPRIGSFHHTVGPDLLENLRRKYGDMVRLAKAARTRPVLYVFHPDMMKEAEVITDTTNKIYLVLDDEPVEEQQISLNDLTRDTNKDCVYDSHATEIPRFEKSPLSHHRKAVGCPVHRDESKAIWAAIRTLLQDGTLIRSYEKAFDDIAVDATRRLGELRHAENALNEELETEIYRWSVETLGVLIFGIRLGCLDGAVHVPTPQNKKPEKTSMDDDTLDQCSLSSRCETQLSPAERLVRNSRDIAKGNYLVRSEGTLKKESATFNSALKAFDRHFNLTEHFLFRALEAMNSGTRKPEQTLLDKLRPLESRILPLAADVLLAGVDPLAQTTINTFYDLSLHAAQQQRAHDEVSWSIASKEAGVDVTELPYIASCVREAMRLYPATGGVVRRSMDNIAVGGYDIPAGVDIVLAHGVTSKFEKEWPRPNSFIPERWCSKAWEHNGPIKASSAHHLASFPFGESCPASGIVSKTVESLVTRVLERYRLEWHGTAPSLATVGVNRINPPFYFVLQNAS